MRRDQQRVSASGRQEHPMVPCRLRRTFGTRKVTTFSGTPDLPLPLSSQSPWLRTRALCLQVGVERSAVVVDQVLAEDVELVLEGVEGDGRRRLSMWRRHELVLVLTSCSHYCFHVFVLTLSDALYPYLHANIFLLVTGMRGCLYFSHATRRRSQLRAASGCFRDLSTCSSPPSHAHTKPVALHYPSCS